MRNISSTMPKFRTSFQRDKTQHLKRYDPIHFATVCMTSELPHSVWFSQCSCFSLCVSLTVLQDMNSEYQQCLLVCKYLSKGQPISDLNSATSNAVTTTDKLIYSCAIEMVLLCSVSSISYCNEILRFILRTGEVFVRIPSSHTTLV